MKKLIALTFFALTLYFTSWSQIPDPAYIPLNYKDTIANTKQSKYKQKNNLENVKFHPKLILGFSTFNFRGDISDNRKSGLIGRSGFQIGLSSNISDYIDASILMEEGILRVNGLTESELPTNFMSTVNSIGLRFQYNFKNIYENNTLTPFLGIGISYLKFDSKGSYNNTNNEYEVDLLDQWILDPNNSEAYSKKTIDIPISIGLNLKVNNRTSIQIGSTYHYTNSDYIDNIKNGSSDKYFVNSANLVYKLYCNCKEKYIPVIKDEYLDVNFEMLDREDEDYDGVYDIDDFCIGTPRGVKVDDYGCPVDKDNDNVPDYLDLESNTPKGAVVNANGIQLTDEMSEKIYLDYINSSSRKDAKTYFEDNYPSDKFIKLSKKVINSKGDTLFVDIYKPKVFKEIIKQQKEFEKEVTHSEYVNTKAKTIYKLQIAKHEKGIEASEINRLMSISNIKSTLEDNFTVYYSGEYDDILYANRKQKQLINSGYSNIELIEDIQGDLRKVTTDEVKEEKNKQAAEKLEDLPPLEDIVFRVQLDALKDVDLDFYDLDELVIFEGKNGIKHVFTEGYETYENALVRRNELYYMGYENAKVVAIKQGEIVKAKDYMDLTYNEDESAIYGEIIFKVQLGILSKNDAVELSKIKEIKDVEKTEISNGMYSYTVGKFTNIQGAMLKLNSLNQQGHESAYIIAFYNNKQISIKKAKELLGF